MNECYDDFSHDSRLLSFVLVILYDSAIGNMTIESIELGVRLKCHNPPISCAFATAKQCDTQSYPNCQPPQFHSQAGLEAHPLHDS